MNLQQRVKRLEKIHPEFTDFELTARVNRVLEQPHLVPPSAYARIVELLEIAKARKANHEKLAKQSQYAGKAE